MPQSTANAHTDIKRFCNACDRQMPRRAAKKQRKLTCSMCVNRQQESTRFAASQAAWHEAMARNDAKQAKYVEVEA